MRLRNLPSHDRKKRDRAALLTEEGERLSGPDFLCKAREASTFPSAIERRRPSALCFETIQPYRRLPVASVNERDP